MLKILLALALLPAMLFAQSTTTRLDEQKIINEEINRIIYTDSAFKQPDFKNPNWRKLQKNIAKKYKGLDAVKLTNGAKIRYYSIKKDWLNFADAYLINLEKYNKVEEISDRLELTFSINNTLYDKIFKNVENKRLLERAALQAKKIIENPYAIKPGTSMEGELSNPIDTYANLLYKAGHLKEAISWQRKAVEYSGGQNKEFKANLEKMENGEKTW